ncbi:MAG TPA: hypothetical protein VM715_07520 [Candidatus Acidoferrum sp.]|nr:hypothetical protein [Candidatus Acidoferrum sp.]
MHWQQEQKFRPGWSVRRLQSILKEKVTSDIHGNYLSSLTTIRCKGSRQRAGTLAKKFILDQSVRTESSKSPGVGLMTMGLTIGIRTFLVR